MPGQKVADYIIERLLAAEVKRIYGIVGDSLNPILDAIRRSDGQMEWLGVRHEEVAAFAAGAEAQVTGGLAVCAGSAGPGNLHLINGLYDAHASNAPVLAIASHITSTEIGTGYHQETHPDQLFRECSDFCELVQTPEHLPRLLHIAMQTALANRAVSVLVLPGDIAEAEIADGWRSHIAVSRPLARPRASEIERLAELIDSADRPVIFAGTGAGEAFDSVLNLATKIKAPVAHSFRGKDDFQCENPHDVGMSGLLGFGGAHDAMHECDLLLLAGTDFPYREFLPESPRVVQIDLRGERLGRRVPLEFGLVGDVGETMRAVLPLVAERTGTGFLDKQLQNHEQALEKLRSYVEHVGKQKPIHPEYLAATIDQLADDDAIFTVDTGMSTVWGARYLHGRSGRRILGSFRHGSMANAMPQAIGAQLAEPARQVVAMCGDGGISMLLGDLLTIAQEKLPVKLVVFNNGVLGMVDLEMQVAGFPDFGTDIADQDFAAIARAAGIHAVRIEGREGVEAGLREVLSHEGPALCDITTDPDALSLPPKVTLDQAQGFGLTMIKKSLSGHIDEVLDTAKSNLRNIPRP